MVVIIKKIIIQFVGTGIYDEYQAYIQLYDTKGNMIYKRKTYNGKLEILLKPNKAYKLLAISYSDIIYKVFYVSKNRDKYTFIFSRSIIPIERTITFLLKDANYNLPVEKGEIILCQK